MPNRHVAPDCSTEQLEVTLATMGFSRAEPASSTVTSTWSRDAVTVHVGDLGFEEPCAFLVTEDGPSGIAGDVSVASLETDEPIDFVYAFDAVAYFEACAQEIGLEDDGTVYVIDVLDDELLFQVALVGACATGTDVDSDAIAILTRAAKSENAELQTAALEAIAWSTWPVLGDVLAEAAASSTAPEANRTLARDILASRKASGWSIWPVDDARGA